MSTSADTGQDAEGVSAVSGERATAERHPFRVVANESGSYDIVAVLDTGYLDRADADAVMRRVLDTLAVAP